MKQRLNIMMYCSPACCILMLAGLLALSSCSSYEDEGAARAKGGVTLSFAMAVDGGATTRSMASDGAATDALTAQWKEGEQVTVAITHDGTTTYKDATVNQISNDKKRAYVSMTVDADKVATGDKMTVIYPAIGTTGQGVMNFTKQDGSLAGDLGLSHFDLRHGESTLVVDGTTATLAADLGLAADLTAYIGAKCVDADGNAIEVKEMTVRPADGDDTGAPAWTNWKTRATFSADGIATDYWGGIIATRTAGSADRIYVAMPAANSGQKMVFTAITADDKVYAVTKTWTGEAGGYYPVTFKMESVVVPEVVNFGRQIGKWAKWDVGATNEKDAVGTPYAFGEICTRNGKTPPHDDGTINDYDVDGYPWNYVYANTPYQTNLTLTSTSTNSIAYQTNWSKYKEPNTNKTATNNSAYVLKPEDDAAAITYGTSWATPTYKEIQALISRGSWSTSGNAALQCTYNGNSILFLLVPYRREHATYGRGIGGYSVGKVYFWTSTLGTWQGNGAAYALHLDITAGGSMFDPLAYTEQTYRCYGCPIRPIYKGSSK